ncbi:hypothetical protein WDU94_010767 [Cyamophila willieti]
MLIDPLLDLELPAGCHLLAYADDVTALVGGRTKLDVQTKGQAVIDMIRDWTERHSLRVAPEKCAYVTLKGSKIAEQNSDGIVVMKWKDKGDVLVLSTKHDDSMKTYEKRGSERTKPAMIVDNNMGKGFIDLSDQMAAYSPYLR